MPLVIRSSRNTTGFGGAAHGQTSLFSLGDWKKLRPHYVQACLWNTPKRFVAAAAGRGSGKTLLAKRKIIKEAIATQNGLYFYALPTYKQAKRVAWLDIKKMFPKECLAKPPHETELYIETKSGSRLYVVGMDKPERIEGSQYDGGVLDEACDQRPDVFQETIRPALTDKPGWCWIIGAIKAGNIGSSSFQKFCESASLICTITGTKENPEGDPDVGYYNWPSSTVLTESEIVSAQRQLDALTFDTQMGATWQNVRGSIFYSFSEKTHTRKDIVYLPQFPIVVGSDFNVNPMCWVLGHFVTDDNGNNGKLLIFDELHIADTNTEATLDILYERYGHHRKGWHFFGDASSRNRKTSASLSDYLIIKNDTRFRDAQLHYPRQNPRIVDRFACTNKAFRNAAKEIQCYINENCKFLIADLKQRAYKEGTREPNDLNGKIGHSSDALGYICYKLFPPAIVQTVSSNAEIRIQG